jgi:hypothetical protein
MDLQSIAGPKAAANFMSPSATNRRSLLPGVVREAGRKNDSVMKTWLQMGRIELEHSQKAASASCLG